MSRARIEIEAVTGLGEIREGDQVGRLIAGSAAGLDGGDVVVVSQKAVSKAEGRVVNLAGVTPGARARKSAPWLA